MKKENKVGSPTLSDFKTYYRARLIKTVGHWHENRYIHQRHRIKTPEINPYIYGQLIFNKRVETIKWGKNIFQVVLGQLDSHMQKNESSHTITKINSN